MDCVPLRSTSLLSGWPEFPGKAPTCCLEGKNLTATALTASQPHPDEGHPPPLEAVPVPWKSVGPCKSHRESLGGLPETPAGEEAQGEEGPAATQLDVSRLRSSSMEIREKGSEFLKEELHKAQKELKLKDEECERLSKVREQLEQELEELTASLFEEAHKMVREANMKQAASEKQLKEARGKIDMLQAEVTALKTLVITSTPASPNRELHPQLLSPTKAGPRKGHLRHKSTSSALCPAVCPVAGHILTPDKEGKEVDTTLFAEFQAWRESPTLDKTSPFLERVYREDVGPCLDFTMQELSALVRAAVEDNTLTIEPVASQTLPAVKVAAVDCGHTNGFRAPIDTTCALSGLACACRHRIRLGDSESHYYISPSSRARITAVCNFFTYIRYIQQGLVRQDGYESDRCHLQGSQVISTQQFAGPQRGASKRSGHSQRSSVPKDWGVLERSPCSGRSPGCGRRCHWPSSASSPTRPRAWPRPRGRL